MLLTTERLLLRPWQEADVNDLYFYSRDPDVGPACGWAPHQSLEESRAVLRGILSGPECYALCIKETNKPIGTAELMLRGNTDVTDRADECELGYWLGKPYWGRGYMPEAAAELLRHAFEDLNMRAVWCGYHEGNDKSRRVQEKLGFVFHHAHPVQVLGQQRISRVNRLTREQWLTRR
ncbi:GNAT family N-acetyltransferase [Gemmiger formicilis]|uniref:GNAT family N-acetyltransferase n=1 Tax=Gemmiger formicilis TaxID=745368 RepID=UPI00195D426B|nr:GNAT family N-acetyltransferase [Gemmiger formicilis]MBM6915872.1 GNAT family N-acetyltransferase [Gemmiger formicilis]